VLRHSEAWDVIPKAYSLLKHLANIFGESDLRALLVAPRAASVVFSPVPWP